MPPAAAAARPALVLGRYRPLRPLGSGGSGSVWLALDERSGLEVALKVVARDGKAGERAEREAIAASRLRHERCLRAYALAHDERHVYVAYEYVPGRTLRDALRSGELDDRRTVEAAAQVLDALAHAHGRGVLHRDVKPANVLLAEGDEVSVRLLDFGLAAFDDAPTLTALGDVPGTLAYIAPERLRGEPATPAADVWAVGVILWEALAGEHPFWKPSLLESARAIEIGAPPLAARRPDLPQPLLAAVARALALDPARRPPAAQLAALLRSAYRPAATARAGAARAPLAPDRVAAAGLAGLLAGGASALLPFFPAPAPAALALVAGVAALARPRAGLALALAVPVLPLGNVALGLALAYAGLAALWLALFAREPRLGLLPALGPLLAPLGLLGLLPLTAQGLRSPFRRALAAAAGVLLALAAAAAREAAVPLTGERPPAAPGLAGSEDALGVAATLAGALATRPALLACALAFGLAAALLPAARRRGPLAVAGWGAALLAAVLLPVPGVAALPVVAAVWATCVAVWAWDSRAGGAGEGGGTR